MATIEQDVYKYYSLPTPYPEEWPAELDENDSENEFHNAQFDPNSSRAKTRYSALHQGDASGFHKSGDGNDDLVQKDEPDPLGTSESVVKLLKHRGLSVEQDSRTRNRFLLSSTSFSPALFLSQAHSSTSTQSLLQGLDYLSRSIDQKSASLKVLVESNFERFVRAKATIDNVYTEMRNQGDQSLSQKAHSRSTSRSSSRMRSYSPGIGRGVDANPTITKNSLTKESEYGVKGIQGALFEASDKADEVWGPALGGRQREDDLKAVVNAIEKQREVYEVGGNLVRFIKQRDYGAIVDQYTRARRYANEARDIANTATTSQRPLADDQIHSILVTGRMWVDVEKQVESFKRDLWRRLSNVQTTAPALTADGPVEEHMEIIGTLLELGVEDNPVWVWLLGRYDYLRTRITTFCERSKVEIEILRRRLAASDRPTPHTVARFLRLSKSEATRSPTERLDTDPVLELWECVHTYLNKLLSLQGGVLGDVIEFWDTAQSFIDGSKQKLLPAGFDGESRKHHRLSPGGVNDLRNGIVELVNLIRESVLALFADPPPEDISRIYTNRTTSPHNALTPTESRYKLDNLPPVSPKKGEPWEDFAFWPPYSNSLSGVHYLSKFLVIVGTAASEMASLGPVSGNGTIRDRLKLLVGTARERSTRAACAAWNKDAEYCKYLEDWTRDQERRDMTKMSGLFVAFESTVLSGMQKILYISEAMTSIGDTDVVTPPPAKLLQLVRSQFVTSVYKALSGVVENAEHPISHEGEDEWILLGPGSVDGPDFLPSTVATGGIDSKNRVRHESSIYMCIYTFALVCHADYVCFVQNVRMLLTLSNLRTLRSEHLPQLVANFETSFSVKLTDESQTIQDVLGQIDARLFQSYTRPMITSMNSKIREGIASPSWVPSTNRPDQVRSYVYAVMLDLVLVHTEVSTTLPTSTQSSSSTTTSLSTAIMSHLVTQISYSLLSAFTSRSRYTLPALMQATLDTEFIAQTMAQYVADEAQKIQSQIYVELDQRTNNEARSRLQAELGEMRGVLRRLREATRGEFACFRKPRNGAGPR